MSCGGCRCAQGSWYDSRHMDTNTTSNSYFLPIAVVGAGILIAGAVMWNGSRPSTGSPQAGGTPPSADASKVNIEGAPFVGSANAPVTLIEWADFQCPFCKRFETETLPQIVKDYVDTGKVKVVFMEFAFLGTDSTDAGIYRLAVWKLYPEKYMAWRTAMYNAQDAENGGFGNAASIDKLNATVAGLDAVKIAADVKANAGTYKAKLDADREKATKVGIGATPSFVIGTQVIAGAYPFATFQTAIDALLK